MMKCKVEKFEVEKKSSQVKFEGSNGGTWVSVTERSRGFVVSVGFGREEVDWLTEHLKKAVELENTRGFTRKFRGENKIHLMEICFNNRGRFMKITEIATRRKPLLLVIPEGVKGNGWEVLRRAILSVQDYSDQVGEELKKTFGNTQMTGKWARAVICECKEKVQDWTHEGKAIARMMGVKGMVSINPISAFKGCFFVSTAGRAKWFQEQERLLVKGRPGRVTKVAREVVKLLDLTKVKLWVEMHPNVVLPALLEVEDGAWKHTIAVSVIEEEGEDDTVTSETSHCRYEWLKEGGCVSQTTKFAEGLRGSIRGNECYSRELLPRARYRCSMPETSTKAHPVRAQSGRKSRGLHAGPDAPQAHDAAASPSSLQRVGSSAKATTQPRSGDERAGVEVIHGEDGRADELQAQTLSNPSPPSETEDASYGRRTVGCKSISPSGLGLFLGGSKSSGMKGRSREEESAARKGKAPMVQMEDFTQGEKTMDSRKMWSKLFLPSATRRHGQRSSSDPLPLRSAAPLSEVRNLEVDGGMGSQQIRGIRESPIFHCLLPRICNS
ncbi:hypothetical protein CK203_083364 [Vitis vinifera]|uniref:DUF4283 domain-containing protein n=1 Tax=Vitis vinifera TaxID=29760 RepID=A0A438BVT4_VITVI|nr:hypothetical protein CK203_083364 [Vitis vinifera]